MDGEQRNGPSMSDLVRRLQRVEDRLDERIATLEMLRATERLFEAKDLAYAAIAQSLEQRVERLETANSRLVQGVIVAFLGLVVQAIVIIFQVTGK